MRHLLDTRTLAREDALRILDVAEDMRDTQSREIKKLPTLRGKTIVNLFFEDSTRTRISFEAAAKAPVGRRDQLLRQGLQREQGRVPAGHRPDAAGDGARMPWSSVIGASGAPQTLATSAGITAGVVNAGDGTHEHPTQALLDAFTIRKRRFGDDSRGRDLAGVHVAIVGDIPLARRRPLQCGCCTRSGPRSPSWRPRRWFHRTCRAGRLASSTTSTRALAARPDAVMMLRIQLERMSARVFPDLNGSIPVDGDWTRGVWPLWRTVAL